jgi:hypothetical protein
MGAFRRLERRPVRPYAGQFISEEEPGGFLPTEIAGCVFWVRADRGITLGTGLGVSAWVDQSGTGDVKKNLLQATAIKQPTFIPVTASYNFKPTLSFPSASAQYVQSVAWSAALVQPATAVIVGNCTQDTTRVLFDGIDGTNRLDQFVTPGFWNVSSNGGATEISVATATAGSPSVFVGIYNGASSKAYKSAQTPSSGSVGANGLAGLTIGAAFDGTVPMLGNAAEMIIYNRVLSQSEVNQILAYGGSRYSIAIGP